MLDFINGFLRDEDGLETVEVVVVMVIVVSLAFAFKSKLQDWFSALVGQTNKSIGRMEIK